MACEDPARYARLPTVVAKLSQSLSAWDPQGTGRVSRAKLVKALGSSLLSIPLAHIEALLDASGAADGQLVEYDKFLGWVCQPPAGLAPAQAAQAAAEAAAPALQSGAAQGAAPGGGGEMLEKAKLYRRCLMTGSLLSPSGETPDFRGLCGRICRGDRPQHFETFLGPRECEPHEPPRAKLVSFMGSGGLGDLVGMKTCLDMLLSVGYTALYIYEKIARTGCSFALAVMPSGNAWKGDWDGLFQAIQSEYPELWPVVDGKQDELRKRSFEDLEEDYVRNGWPCLHGLRAKDDGAHITLDKLQQLHRAGEGRAYHVRAYLYLYLNIRANFRGDGYVWKSNGERGPREYIARNDMFADLKDAVFCPLGSVSVEEVTKYVCDSLREEQRVKELRNSRRPKTSSVLEAPPEPQAKALTPTPVEYLQRFQTGKALGPGERLSGLCGRICRGSHTGEFLGLAEMDGSRRAVFMFGPDGLARFLGNTRPLALLLELGYDVLFIYEELQKGTVFELVVFKEKEGVVQATWDNLPGLVREAFEGVGEELAAIIAKHLLALKETSFHDLQNEYTDEAGNVMSMHEARGKPPMPLGQVDDVSPWRMNAELLLRRERAGTCRTADVRAFLYHALNLNNLYSGDGYTWSHDGKQGISEYLAANLPRTKLGKMGEDWVSCSIGSPTLDECMVEICNAYETALLRRASS